MIELEKVLLKHSNTKNVTIVAHDFGVTVAYFFLQHRPDLIKRMAVLDIGGM